MKKNIIMLIAVIGIALTTVNAQTVVANDSIISKQVQNLETKVDSSFINVGSTMNNIDTGIDLLLTNTGKPSWLTLALLILTLAGIGFLIFKKAKTFDTKKIETALADLKTTIDTGNKDVSDNVKSIITTLADAGTKEDEIIRLLGEAGTNKDEILQGLNQLGLNTGTQGGGQQHNNALLAHGGGGHQVTGQHQHGQRNVNEAISTNKPANGSSDSITDEKIFIGGSGQNTISDDNVYLETGVYEKDTNEVSETIVPAGDYKHTIIGSGSNTISKGTVMPKDTPPELIKTVNQFDFLENILEQGGNADKVLDAMLAMNNAKPEETKTEE